jgi:hypothetical protein
MSFRARSHLLPACALALNSCFAARSPPPSGEAPRGCQFSPKVSFARGIHCAHPFDRPRRGSRPLACCNAIQLLPLRRTLPPLAPKLVRAGLCSVHRSVSHAAAALPCHSSETRAQGRTAAAGMHQPSRAEYGAMESSRTLLAWVAGPRPRPPVGLIGGAALAPHMPIIRSALSTS